MNPILNTINRLSAHKLQFLKRNNDITSARLAKMAGRTDLAKKVIDKNRVLDSPVQEIGVLPATFSQFYMTDLPNVDNVDQRELYRDYLKHQRRRQLETDKQVYRTANKLADQGVRWVGQGLLSAY